MDDNHSVQCPWCWESLELYIDPESSGQLIEDCEVCCRPWVVFIDRSEDRTHVHIERGN